MELLKELISIDKSSDTAIYLQISNSIINNIRRGRLRRGARLAGSRELAEALGIHRKTILAAYDELMAQGWIEMIPRKGTFVVQELPEIRPQKITEEEIAGFYPSKTNFFIEDKRTVVYPNTDFPDLNNLIINDGFPDIRLAPMELFARELRSVGRQNAFKKYYLYGDARGTDYLRETLSSFLSDTRGLPLSPENIMVTRGAQMGIYLAASILLKPGDQVIVGEPNYFAATKTFQQLDANINTVPVDDMGIDVDQVELLCKKKKIRMLYVIPHHHQPTTVTLSPERRIRLLDLASKYKFAIIEDDYDYDFHYTSNPIMPMASLDHNGNVIYIGTLTKTFAPALRIGFVVAPSNFINAIANLRMAIDRQGDSMIEIAIAQLYRNGSMARHIKKSVKVYHERRDHFCKLMKEQLGERVSFKIPGGGMSVWTKFNTMDLKLIAERAAKKGLIMSNGALYNVNVNYNSTRTGFASLNFEEQEAAIEILSKII